MTSGNPQTSDSVLLKGSALSALRLDTPNLREVSERKGRKPMNREICLCGHSVNNHKDYGDEKLNCSPAKQFCPCEQLLPVIEVESTKYFLRRTWGYGEKHALAIGLHYLTKNGLWSRMIIDPVCFKCGNMDCTIYPTPISRMNTVSNGPSGVNVFLCLDCIDELHGRPAIKS